MAAIQLNFNLRTSAKCKTVHLIGSWDNYAGQLPLSKDSTKSGGWKGTFRFQGATLQQGQRYWYYYIIDGYHVSHDPARESTTEPTTGRKLNILDIPSARGSVAAAPALASVKSSSRHSRHMSVDVAKGRSLSPSQIQSPAPSKPYATRGITSEQYNQAAMEMLAAKYAAQRLSPASSVSSASSRSYESDDSSNPPSLSSRSSNSSSPSSVSTSSCCTCERYAITRSGNRVKLDCGGARCGYSDSSSDCSSSDGESEILQKARTQGARRQGMVVRR